MQALLWPLISWIFREVVIKFVILAAVFVVVVALMPLVFEHLAPFILPQALTDAFTALPPGIWWGLDFFRMDVGVPLIISAHVARFLIRRIPLVG